MIDQRQIDEAIERLRQIEVRNAELLTARDFAALTQGLALALTAVSEGMGECRLDVPYAAIRPVFRTPGKLEWGCTHDQPHWA